MPRLKYTCRLSIDIDEEECPIPLDGDFSNELHDIIEDMIHECDGIYLMDAQIVKRGKDNG